MSSTKTSGSGMSILARGTGIGSRGLIGRFLIGAKRPVPAIPVDLLRILFGTIGLIYFVETLRAASDFSNPNGLIDHGFVRDAFWYTRLSPFPSGIGLGALRVTFAAACAACVLLVVGYRPRLMAVFSYVVAVATYRWNFPVTYLDDATVHLTFFWLMLLPTGTTLTIVGCRSAEVRSAWRERWVPGVAVRCLLANVTLLYVVAGLWKWTSPMWRDGTALYVALQTPISRAPDFWSEGWLPALMVASYAALVLEPLLPAMFVLPSHHWLKWSLFAGAVGLHLGILIAMKIPYTNAVLLAVSVVTFRDEIMRFVHHGARVARPPAVRERLGPDGRIAIGFVVLLTLAMVGEVTVAAWRQPTRVAQASSSALVESFGTDAATDAPGVSGSGHNPMYAPLWMIGIAQSYRLFDWVDDRNWDIRHEVVVRRDGDEAGEQSDDHVFGSSMRHVLLQTYVHGVTWGPLAGSDLSEFRRSVLDRYATRYCADHDAPGSVDIDVFSLVRRITRENSAARERERELLMSFECRDRLATLNYVSELAG